MLHERTIRVDNPQLWIPKGNFIQETLGLRAYWNSVRQAAFPQAIIREVFYGSNSLQYYLHIRPTEITKTERIIYIHGGGWQFGNAWMFKNHGLFFAKQGYETFVITHRKIPFTNIYGIRSDIHQAMQTITNNLASANGGIPPLLLGGMSSGANLAALQALDNDNLIGQQQASSFLKGLFLLGAPVQLRGMWPSPPLLFLAGWKRSKRFKHANPYDHLNHPINLPTLLIHGKKDGLVEFSSVTAFAERLKEYNSGLTTFIAVEDGTHLDVARWVYQADPVYHALLDWLNERSNS